MAKIKGFEVKAVKTVRGEQNEQLLQANLYYEGKRIGHLQEQSGIDPAIVIEARYQEKWTEALSFFKGYSSLDNNIDWNNELFDHLIALKEWEKLFKKEIEFSGNILVVFEEIDAFDGYRTGGYTVFVVKNAEEMAFIEEKFLFSTAGDSPVKYLKHVFRILDEFDKA